jgi:hypothetical protein
VKLGSGLLKPGVETEGLPPALVGAATVPDVEVGADGAGVPSDAKPLVVVVASGSCGTACDTAEIWIGEQLSLVEPSGNTTETCLTPSPATPLAQKVAVPKVSELPSTNQ